MERGEAEMRLLIAEDEQDLNRLLAKALRKEGYTVDACLDGEEAMDCLLGAQYDGIILDVMMPKKDGHQVLREMRNHGDQTPVLFLTARDSVADRVQGLDLGADDYLIKPFDFDELLARVRALTRRAGSEKNTLLTLADLTVDTVRHTAVRDGVILDLSAKEYALLEYLISHQGAVISRQQIENSLWSYDYSGGSNVVDVYISYLRKKLDGNREKKLLHTVRGAGWTLREDG